MKKNGDILKFFFPLLFAASVLITSCYSPEEDIVMTVNGTIFASDLGVTLHHEHVLVDWIGADSTGYHRWDREEVIERVLPYFHDAAGRGVQTIGDFTPAYLGRDPFVLAELSRRTGMNIITNTGFYGAVDRRFIPNYAYDETATEIAARWIDEFENGIDGSEIRPGFMKISVIEQVELEELDKKLVEAAAIAHLATGLKIFSHTIGDVPARGLVELLKEVGVAPGAFVWTHAQSGSMDALLELAEQGAWIALDGIRFDPAHEPGETESIEWYIERLTALKEAGFLERVLISHDAGWYDVGEPDGGDFRSYTDIFDFLISGLDDAGFSDEEISALLVDNPARALSLVKYPTER